MHQRVSIVDDKSKEIAACALIVGREAFVEFERLPEAAEFRSTIATARANGADFAYAAQRVDQLDTPILGTCSTTDLADVTARLKRFVAGANCWWMLSWEIGT